ncbi:MAG: SLC13 family permease [Hyphomonadaceae bacterium]
MSEAISQWPMWASLIVVVGAILAYMTDRWSMELTSIAIIATLVILFQIPGARDFSGEPLAAADLFAGFGNPALITIMALLVVGQGLFQTGALEGPTHALLDSYDKRPRATLMGAFFAVFAISAFINNTPVVIMFLPVMNAIASSMGSSPSKLMMPLSFASVFAGMTTLIGTSTNLLVAETYTRVEGEKLGFFTQTPVGLILAGVGMLYLLFASRYLLPDRQPMQDAIVEPKGKQFVAQIEVTFGHFLAGKQPVAGRFEDMPDVTVRLIQRGEKAILPPFENVTLLPDDLVIVAATRKALIRVLSAQPEMLRQIWRSKHGEQSNVDIPRSLALTEVVIAPGSRMAGRTVEMLALHQMAHVVTLGIQRRSRMIRTRFGSIRLEAGDTLLLFGPIEAFQKLRTNRDLILLEWSQIDIPITGRGMAARLIAAGMVVTAATSMLPILSASVIAAVAMIAVGCLNVRQAGRALDLRIFLVIGAALAMGLALEKTGAANLIAGLVVDTAAPFGPVAVLSVIFLAVALLTNVLSNAATAVLFGPIALSAVDRLNEIRALELPYADPISPLPFILAVIYGANCCFATPIAYQTNMLVMGPGHYKFSDFLRFGGPLVLLLWAIFTIIAPWLFDLGVA